MNSLTISEFKEFSERQMAGCKFIFLSENQKNYNTRNNLQFDIVFDKLNIHIKPNTIVLKCGNNKLTINGVIGVEISETPCVLGIVFDIICENIVNKTSKTRCTVIAQ